MAFTYILISKIDGKKYIGSTRNLEKRIREHNTGKVFSTASRRPLTLFAYRRFREIGEAALWEKKYKNSHGQLERDLKGGLLTIIIKPE